MSTSATRVQRHRENLREKGLKLIQIWVPNTQSKGFSAECKRQALLVKQDENENEKEINDFILNASDVRDWE